MQADIKEAVRKAMLELLEDREFRYAVAGAIGLHGILERLSRSEEAILKLAEEIKTLREDMSLGFKKHGEEMAKLREDMTTWLKKHDEELVRLREDMTVWLKRHDKELVKLREDMNKMREEMAAWLKKHGEELVKLREDMNRAFTRHYEELAKLREDINGLRKNMDTRFDRLDRKIEALGARWGIKSEEAFRAGMRGVVERELGLKVERWTARDDEGFVYGYPSDVEIDLAVRNEKVILIEIKSSVSADNILSFVRKAQLYERKTGVKPSRLIVVTPYADENAIKAASNLGVEIYSV